MNFSQKKELAQLEALLPAAQLQFDQAKTQLLKIKNRIRKIKTLQSASKN